MRLAYIGGVTFKGNNKTQIINEGRYWGVNFKGNIETQVINEGRNKNM